MPLATLTILYRIFSCRVWQRISCGKANWRAKAAEDQGPRLLQEKAQVGEIDTKVFASIYFMTGLTRYTYRNDPVFCQQRLARLGLVSIEAYPRNCSAQ